MKTRERWLLEAIEGVSPLFRAAGFELPVVKVSVGFPPIGGLKKNRRVLGVCFPKTMTKDDGRRDRERTRGFGDTGS